MAQYKLAHIDMKGNRGELHDLLNLTGAEVSCNTLPPGPACLLCITIPRMRNSTSSLRARGCCTSTEKKCR